jgi:hypothetical protein
MVGLIAVAVADLFLAARDETACGDIFGYSANILTYASIVSTDQTNPFLFAHQFTSEDRMS